MEKLMGNIQKGPVLVASGETLKGLEAAKWIASKSKEAHNLLGADAEAQKEVGKILQAS